jgi:nucleoside phosphorylase
MEKRYFDVAVVAPLEEEFEAALSPGAFVFKENLSTDRQVRFAVSALGANLQILLVKQGAMGKTETQTAMWMCLSDFQVGSFVCLGIAGGLSSDVKIGDVCFTGSVMDLLDNARASDNPESKAEVAFSPTYYESPLEISVAVSLYRILPESKSEYETWRTTQETFALSQIPDEYPGRNGLPQRIQKPNVHHGLIACGAVSASEDYNNKIKGLNRKVLALDTESGGLFATAKVNQLPALSVRGIADYAGAGIDKNEFETKTNGKARLVAATNAASFLTRLLARPQVQKFLIEQSGKLSGKIQAQIGITINALANTLVSEGERYETKLRDLAPTYPLQAKGYRIPVPRVRLSDDRQQTGAALTEPIELRDAVRNSRVLILQIPQQYPDLSLAWIVGRDLLLAHIGDKQLVPCVLEASKLSIPKTGIRELAGPSIISFENSAEAQLVFVVDDFNFGSKTRTSFLQKEIESFPDAKFLIITRGRSNLFAESDFSGKTSAVIAEVCDISFTEIALFLQKNFEMEGPAAEVIATRLRDTFEKFDLPVHPTYFAGIPGTTLSALLQANRRAELIELAVAGYLSYVVSQDSEPVALSRTTREKFLTALAYEISLEKKSFSEADLAEYATAFAKKFDFPYLRRASSPRSLKRASFILKPTKYGLLCLSWNPICSQSTCRTCPTRPRNTSILEDPILMFQRL